MNSRIKYFKNPCPHHQMVKDNKTFFFLGLLIFECHDVMYVVDNEGLCCVDPFGGGLASTPDLRPRCYVAIIILQL